MTERIPYHPYADLYPMMSAEDRRALLEDMRKNGLRVPILLFEGQILDGRNRYECCLELGIEPRFVEYTGDDALAEVRSLNGPRRHLTPQQKAAAALEYGEYAAWEAEAKERQRRAAEITNARLGRASTADPETLVQSFAEPSLPAPTSRERAAAEFGANPDYVQKAKAIRALDPSLYQRVKDDLIPIGDAYRQVRNEKEWERIAARPKLSPSDAVKVVLSDTTAHVESGTVDLAFLDPPYNISDPNKLTKVGRSNRKAVFADWDMLPEGEFWMRIRKLARELARLLVPGGSALCCIDRWKLTPFLETFRGAGLRPKEVIVWEKENPHPASRMHGQLISATEFIVWAVKPGKRWTSNKVPPSEYCPRGWDLRNIITTRVIGAAEKVDHPHQKPQELLCPLLTCFSNPGDMVLDPFAGSGSTGVAAMRLGRRCHLIECDPKYVKLCEDRLAKEGGR